MSNDNTAAIGLDQALAGMALSEAIRDDRLGVLLPAGTVLTEAAIASLRRRGIAKLCIAAQENSPAALLAMREHAQERLHHLFRNSGDEGAGRSLLNGLVRYRLE